MKRLRQSEQADKGSCQRGLLFKSTNQLKTMKVYRIILTASLVLPLFLGSFLTTAHATVFEYNVTLNGPNEAPPNASPGTGFADILYNDVLHSLYINLAFSGLVGTTTASHIHAATALPGVGTAGVATTTPYFAGFPIGVTSGTYIN